jgi:glutathione S-transferase
MSVEKKTMMPMMKMPKIHLWWFPLSQPCRAVKALLDAGDIPYESHCVNPLKGENKTPEILALQPSGAIPFITVDGQTYNESAAILRFIACKFPSCHKYYPEGVEHRAKIDAMLDFNGTTLREPSMGAFRGIVFQRMKGTEPDVAAHEAAKASNEKLLGILAGMESSM